ncbi:riboflavin kinase [Microbacterium sp. YY-01]|uniref:riboflavin kinase n=1 Tax=Microbacterium sp. YY-01 TaxID=3421634 RepID=UPI003D16CC0A
MHWRVVGTVVHGDGRGRELGYPTANLDTHDLLPPPGIYAAWVRTAPESQADAAERAPWQEATVSVGDNPTFGDVDTERAECYLHDFSGDLYGAQLEVVFVAYIREMAAFSHLDDLIRNAAGDVARSRELLAHYPQAAM